MGWDLAFPSGGPNGLGWVYVLVGSARDIDKWLINPKTSLISLKLEMMYFIAFEKRGYPAEADLGKISGGIASILYQ